MASAIQLTDPTFRPKAKKNVFDRAALHFINDERDLPFIYLTTIASLCIFPFAVYLFVPGSLNWWLPLVYLGMVYLAFAPPFILMLHNTSHRKLFKRKYKLLNQYIPWVLGPFIGETPDTYFAHHVGMHHAENNLPKDLSSTMKYQRDKFTHFMRYFFRFFFGGVIELGMYHWHNRRRKLLRRMLFGELGFYALCIGLLFFNWQAVLVVFVIPFTVTRFLMMCGNWGQHAFVDHSDPGNSYKNSITCINSGYNKRCFNDGYHIGHHVKATRHWTDMPVDFEKSREQYAEQGCVVFEKIDFFVVWMLLMLKAYGTLAKFYVELDGKGRSKEEIIALLKERTRQFSRAELEEFENAPII